MIGVAEDGWAIAPGVLGGKLVTNFVGHDSGHNADQVVGTKTSYLFDFWTVFFDANNYDYILYDVLL